MNLPVPVVNEAYFKAGDFVDERYVEGIGVIVSLPIKFPLSMSERLRRSPVNTVVKKGGRKVKSEDVDFIEVIPLRDGLIRRM